MTTAVVNTSSTIFAAFLQCPTKCYLYSAGERGAGNSYAHRVQAQETESPLHAVERVVSGRPGKSAQFIPIRFVLREKLRDRCRLKLIEKDDLSLLSRMTAQEHKEYHNKGISTVTQLSYPFRPRRRPKHLRGKREKYHLPLKALAVREKKIYVVGSPELKIEGTPVYLDVEGLPDRDFYYLIGLRVGTGDAAVQHSFWADDPSQEKTIWEGFLHLLGSVKDR